MSWRLFFFEFSLKNILFLCYLLSGVFLVNKVLIPKVLSLCFGKNTLKLPFLNCRSILENNFFFHKFNQKILKCPTAPICDNQFSKFDRIDWKIIVFGNLRKVFLYLPKQDQAPLIEPCVTSLHYMKWVFHQIVFFMLLDICV